MQGKNRRKSREQYWIVIYIQYVSWWINFRNISELDMVLQMEKKLLQQHFLNHESGKNKAVLQFIGNQKTILGGTIGKTPGNEERL